MLKTALIAIATIRIMKALATFMTTVASTSGRPGTSPIPPAITMAGITLASRSMTPWRRSSSSRPKGVLSTMWLRIRRRTDFTTKLANSAASMSAPSATNVWSHG